MSGLDWHRGNQTSYFGDNGNYSTYLIAAQAVDFLKRQASAQDQKPFFLYECAQLLQSLFFESHATVSFPLITRYLPWHAIHGPNEVPAQYEDLYPVLKPEASASSQGMCGVCECPGIGELASGRHGGKWDAEFQRESVAQGGATWGQCRTVLGMAAALDWGVGQVVDALHANNQWESTIIIYTSDNGAQQGQGGTSYPLRGTVRLFLLS